MLKTHGTSLNKALLTLMAEVEAIMISQPLTVELLNDGNSFNLISLSTLLTRKNRVVMPPLEEFGTADIYCLKAGEDSNIFLKDYALNAKKNFW